MEATRDVRWCASLAEDKRGTTTAWVVTLAACRAFVDPALAPNATDRADIGGRRGADAERFMQRRLTLRSLVARWCGAPADRVMVGYDGSGRPAVRWPSNGPFCSVAARGTIAGFALSDSPVGIDLELLASAEIASAALTPGEQAALATLPEAARVPNFLTLWTVKEAYLKALGTGLLRDPSTLGVTLETGILSDAGRPIRLHPTSLQRLEIDNQPMATACISLPGDRNGCFHRPCS